MGPRDWDSPSSDSASTNVINIVLFQLASVEKVKTKQETDICFHDINTKM